MGVSWVWLIIGFCFGALMMFAAWIIYLKVSVKWLRKHNIKMTADDIDKGMDYLENL